MGSAPRRLSLRRSICSSGTTAQPRRNAEHVFIGRLTSLVLVADAQLTTRSKVIDTISVRRRHGHCVHSETSMSWFKIADGRLRFRGRITKQPVIDWLTSEDGTAAVQAAASQIRFALFGRLRAARRRMRRELWEAVDAPAVREVIAAECDSYLAAWAELAYAPSLPRATIALQRLVVVPRTMILARTLSRVMVRVAACPAIADLLGFLQSVSRSADPLRDGCCDPARGAFSQPSCPRARVVDLRRA